ncbi:TPR-like protein [Marasmius fiardii PR-910]|nr:TPR-like protein [Marasmius fiardii PR-910]
MVVDSEIVCELRIGIEECSKRCLLDSSKWLSELLLSIPSSKRKHSNFSTSTPARNRNNIQDSPVPTQIQPDSHRHPHAPALQSYIADIKLEQIESDQLSTAKSLIQFKDYQQIPSFLIGCTSSNAIFLSLYSQILAYELRSGQNWHSFDHNRQPIPLDLEPKIQILLSRVADTTDPFLLYLKALFYSRLGLREEAIENSILSIAGFPWNWASWCLLASCIDDGEELSSLISLLPLPQTHPLVQIFQVKTLIDLHIPTDNELSLCDQLVHPDYFPGSLWIMSLKACGFFYMHEFNQAESQFDKILSLDPQRVEDIDILSNILYVTDNRLKLTKLVHSFIPLGEDKPEICCLLGNYYSLRGEHPKAIKYFRRAVELEPRFLSAWTLLGHEYVEVKNSHMAIWCYRRAVDSDRKDYRAWYGLGQAYELLNMHQYALHYYQFAAALRPYDARLWQGLGQCYEEMGRLRESIECYKRALISTNPHEISLNILLAKVHKDLDEIEESVAYHRRVVEVCQADLRPIHEYSKSALEVAEHQLKLYNLYEGVSGGNWDLYLAKEYIQIVARSNSEEVIRSAEVLKEVLRAIEDFEERERGRRRRREARREREKESAKPEEEEGEGKDKDARGRGGEEMEGVDFQGGKGGE